ncbi:hypothetical protein QSI_0730 [Clostridioides difficile P28]|nr:hypothetical protein QSI_0730 [Clostridioides difficile P28]
MMCCLHADCRKVYTVKNGCLQASALLQSAYISDCIPE